MKLRAIAVTLAILASLVATQARADDKNTEIARAKFNEGVTAYDAGQYEKARTLFLQAYALKRHPLVLLNLGQSELKSGHIEDAGNHLQQFLRDYDSPSAQQKKDAETGVAECEKKTGYVILIVDVDGADLAVDGNSIGKSPFADSYFVSVGKHEASASKGGKTAKADFDAKRGSATPVNLSLGGGAIVAPVPVPDPDPVPSPDPTVDPVPAPVPFTPTPTPIAPAPMPPQPPFTTPGEGPDTGREDLIPWFKRKPGAWVLVGLGGAGIIGTIAFGIAAGSANAAANDVSDQILTEVERGESEGGSARLPPQYWSNGDGTGEPQPCGNFDDPNSSFGHYQDACNQLRDNIDAYDADLIGVGISVGVAVLSVAGLTAYYFIDTSNKSGATASGSINFVPILSPDANGLSAIGTF